MRILARFGLGLCAAWCSASRPAARAGDTPAPPDPAAAAEAQAPGHHHKGLFGWRHCVECQRAVGQEARWRGRASSPVDLAGRRDPRPGRFMQHGTPRRPARPARPGDVIVGPVTTSTQSARARGRGRAGRWPRTAPGYAVVGGATARRWRVWTRSGRRGTSGPGPRWDGPRMAAGGPRPGSAAPMIRRSMPSSMIPAQTALDSAPTGRPHVISHLFGFGGISRHAREAREDRCARAARVDRLRSPGPAGQRAAGLDGLRQGPLSRCGSNRGEPVKMVRSLGL